MKCCCVPTCLPQCGWSKHVKGYAIYTSRNRKGTLKRGQFLHRAVVESLLGRSIPSGLQVSHLWPFNKTCGRPETLMVAPPEFNPTPARRCPYTGQFLSPGEFARRYPSPISQLSEVPF
jgi:hypothetical protein